MAYAAAIFDLDGTLLDTLDDLTSSVNVALGAHGLPPRPRREIRSFLGNGMVRLVHLSVPDGTDAALEAAVLKDFMAHYAEHAAERTAPYPGVVSLLSTLADKGVRCGLVSNKGDFAVQSLVATYFPGLFDACVGERKGVRRKPAPDTVLRVMDELRVAASQTVYVGDSEVDLETARNVGCACIAVSWGFRDRDLLVRQGATTIVDTAEELAGAILLPASASAPGSDLTLA
ncbi:HAD family hydrolase [Olsenella sp. HMSC062G07]|uniref:HAD family hydrolase n=1 Tax=Olsenella sp. HMSC062G07 TaxID=1739330 RepID=UPI0008A1182E|nr:HAD family hydrolase [Olsenella sp. HMSC062G07]OFK22345.1 HAD family hydrolase [Olsenella sp. HMSC062G07]